MIINLIKSDFGEVTGGQDVTIRDVALAIKTASKGLLISAFIYSWIDEDSPIRLVTSGAMFSYILSKDMLNHYNSTLGQNSGVCT